MNTNVTKDFNIIYRVKLLEGCSCKQKVADSPWLLNTPSYRSSIGGEWGCFASLSSAKRSVAFKWRQYEHYEIWKFHVGSIDYPLNGYFPPKKVYASEDE